MTKILRTNSGLYEVIVNKDKTLTIKYATGCPIKNPGMFIYTLGGRKALLARCTTTDKTIKEICDEEDAAKAQRRKATNDQITKDYLNMVKSTPIKPTIKNIHTYLAYMNITGDFLNLPFGIPYTMNRYTDADTGYIMTTIVFDRPIDYYGRKESKFVCGASPRQLTKYIHI